jgi:hypothetical protein
LFLIGKRHRGAKASEDLKVLGRRRFLRLFVVLPCLELSVARRIDRPAPCNIVGRTPICRYPGATRKNAEIDRQLRIGLGLPGFWVADTREKRALEWLTTRINSCSFSNIMKARPTKKVSIAIAMVIGAFTVLAFNAKAAVADPSFDTQAPAGHQQEFGGGEKIGGAWTVGNVVTLYDNLNGLGLGLTPNEGPNAVLLRGSSVPLLASITGSVYQNVVVTGGQTYQLNFAFGAAAANSTGALLELKVGFLTGGVFQDFSAVSMPTTMNWQPAQYTFTVPSGKTVARITFTGLSLNTSVDGPISLTVVPEPYQYGLVGVLGMLGLAVRQFTARRKVA